MTFHDVFHNCCSKLCLLFCFVFFLLSLFLSHSSLSPRCPLLLSYSFLLSLLLCLSLLFPPPPLPLSHHFPHPAVSATAFYKQQPVLEFLCEMLELQDIQEQRRPVRLTESQVPKGDKVSACTCKICRNGPLSSSSC